MSSVPPSDIETGVSNGDVDWLFRGKSKKLVKKLNHEKRPSTCHTDRPELSNEESRSAASQKSMQPGTKNEVKNETKTKNDDDKSKSKKLTTEETKVSPSNSAISEDSESENPKASSLRRSRSSSAPQPPDIKPTPALGKSQPCPRRSSLNVNSSTSSNSQMDTSPVSQNISRSGSGRGRSFFTSLSSKFKPSSFSSPSTQSASSNFNSRSTSPTSTPSVNSPKANCNLDNSKDQDFPAVVQRLPSECGIAANSPRSRKSSFSSSPRSSVERERGGFFKRKSSVVEHHHLSDKSPKLNQNKSKNKEQSVLPGITHLQLRRVTFALDKLNEDPQQQIPSRRPRKGNVLVPEDLKAPIPRLAQGISTTDGTRTTVNEDKVNEKQLQLAIEAQNRALLEIEKHAMEAHLSAKRLAAQIATHKFTNKNTTCIQEDEDLSANAEKLEIDNALHMHEHHFEESNEGVSDEETEEASPEVIYTRCCHLREILPIPATLKQLRHKTKPLQILKMLNPKPTLIDVLSFSDFISITPINTVIFDNVTMTTEMLKHVLSSLVHNKHLEKLSLRNVAIDEVGWGYLCEFLSRNQKVKKLDISQQRVKLLTKQTSFRSAMNWELFVSALKSRKGIEELVMGGCKLTDECFENLLENALTISTCRLGMAATEINVHKCELIADWISQPDTKCVGIDIAYNDLSSGQLRPFVKAFLEKQVNLVFFSLNSTSISDVDEMNELLRGLSRVKTLRFLDISSLPQLFPQVISKLNRYLPHFDNLRRIHFDLNELTSQSIAAIADILPKVPNLVHVSLLGNRNLNRASIGALYTAVKSSTIHTLDLDYELVPDELSQRLALYLMRNFDRAITPNIHDYAQGNEQEDVMFDGSLLMETAERMLIESDKTPGEADVKLQKMITNAVIERTNSVRKDMHRVIDTLFEQRDSGKLSFEGKENLLRFCLLDASLEKLVHMLEQKAKMFSSTPLSPSPSISETNKSVPNGSVPDREQLHEGSTALIDAGPILMAKTNNANKTNVFQGNESTLQPHSVVIDAASDGQNVIIDNLTGRPVLMRSVSQTSIHAREQEEEEGEFLRWGYFMEHRKSEDDVIQPQPDESSRLEIPVFGAVPSGSELREAIIDAKGIDRVTDLIFKINTNRVSLDKIYKTDGPENTTEESGESKVGSICQKVSAESLCKEVYQDAADQLFDNDDKVSINSCEDHEVHPVVDEAYDKLLNEAQRVISNKESDCRTQRDERIES